MGSPQERSRAQSRQLGYNAPKPRRWGKGAIDHKGAAFGRCGRTVRFKSGIPRAGARDNLQPGFTQRVAFQGDPPSAWASVLSVSSCEDDGLLSRAELSKQDAGEDAAFWGSRPLLTPYLSAPFLERLQVLYRTFLRDGDKVLDLCCDMDSHLPAELTVNSLVGTGLNRAALAANARLTASFTQDLNRRPKLTQLTNREFDAVLCCAGYEYLQKPLQVLQEARRVLRPGGLVIISFPAKCVVQKAISAWISRSQPERALLVARYLKAAGFERLQAALQDPPPQAQDMVLCNVQGQPGRDPCTIIQSPRPAQVISDFTAVLARRPDLRARPPPGGEEDPTAAPVKLPNSDVILRNFPGCAPPTPDVKPANSGSAAATQKAEQIGASGGAASLTWLPVYNLMVVEARSLGIPASAIPQLPPGAGANEIRAAGTHLSAMMASFTSSGL